jgi:sec-independent protein translocase protein TatB
MSFSETIFLFFLALIIFGPKKLPEIARQAGRLLAELRRASNEFKSQIETEIAHLEVEKREAQKNDQTALPPGAVPPGTVASLSLNPASTPSSPHNPMPAATLAEPTETPSPAIGSEPTSRNETASAFPTDNSSTSNSVSPSEEVTATSDPASQASHV